MLSSSLKLKKTLLFFLFTIPFLIIYQKVALPYFAQTGFDGSIVTLIEIIFIIFGLIFGDHRKLTRTATNAAILVGIWQLIALISASLSDHFHASLIKQIEYLIHFIFAYTAWALLSSENKQEKMSWMLVFTFVWLIYYIFSFRYIQQDPINYDWVNFTPFFNNIRHLGFIQAAVFPLLFLPLLIGLRYSTILTSGLLTIFWCSLFWASSRGTFLTSIILTCLIAWQFKDNMRTYIFVNFAGILLGLTVALLMPTASPSTDPFRLLFLNISGMTFHDINAISSNRVEIWREAIGNLNGINILLGLGANGFEFITPKTLSDAIQPHSSIVQIIMEFGLTGFILLTLSAAYFLKNICNSKDKHSPSNRLAQMSLISILIASLFDGHLYYNFSLCYIALLAAIATPSSSEASCRYLPLTGLAIIGLTFYPLSMHWNTYIQQQFPLLSGSQIKQVKAFPSYYFPVLWLNSDLQNTDLRNEAIELGKVASSQKCNFLLTEYLDLQNQEINRNLIKNIANSCNSNQINKFGSSSLNKALEAHR